MTQSQDRTGEGRSEWQTPETLPQPQEGEEMHVYLAFVGGLVRLANSVAYSLEPEFSLRTLGRPAPTMREAYYVTSEGEDVRHHAGRWRLLLPRMSRASDTFELVGWMTALRPEPEWGMPNPPDWRETVREMTIKGSVMEVREPDEGPVQAAIPNRIPNTGLGAASIAPAGVSGDDSKNPLTSGKSEPSPWNFRSPYDNSATDNS